MRRESGVHQFEAVQRYSQSTEAEKALSITSRSRPIRDCQARGGRPKGQDQPATELTRAIPRRSSIKTSTRVPFSICHVGSSISLSNKQRRLATSSSTDHKATDFGIVQSCKITTVIVFQKSYHKSLGKAGRHARSAELHEDRKHKQKAQRHEGNALFFVTRSCSPKFRNRSLNFEL